MPSMMRFIQLLPLILLAAALLGCGGDGKLTLEGAATWNGAPIENGYVELHPVDGDGQVVGADIVGGEFVIRTFEGTKRVLVTANRKVGEKPPTERVPHPEPIYVQYLPPQYNEKSELTIEFTADDPTVQLDLEGEALTSDAESSEERRRRAAQGGG